MPFEYTYISVDILCILFPIIFSFTRRFYFINEWRYYLAANAITALLFIIWDIFYTSINVWSFNNKYTLGISYMGLPLEEYLFFFCIPYAFAFTYNCFKNQFSFKRSKILNYIQWLVIFALFNLAIANHERIYTSVTFSLLALLLLILNIKQVSFLITFYITYTVILIPFFIANGILTGGIINRMVVVYNNNYNLGIRLFTIPVEDIFYGMLLLLLNTSLYEYIKIRFTRINNT